MEENEIHKGQLLYADPMLHDPYFKRSVIMLVEHNHDGTVGFIMNKQLDIKLDQILPDAIPMDLKVYYGGPVNTNNLYYVHRMGAVIDESIEFADGYYWGGNFETIKSLMYTRSIRSDDIRFFVGYSGWSGGQLKGEINEQSWVVSDGNLDKVFIEKKLAEIWKNKMTSMGDKYALWANFPENPGLN